MSILVLQSLLTGKHFFCHRRPQLLRFRSLAIDRLINEFEVLLQSSLEAGKALQDRMSLFQGFSLHSAKEIRGNCMFLVFSESKIFLLHRHYLPIYNGVGTTVYRGHFTWKHYRRYWENQFCSMWLLQSGWHHKVWKARSSSYHCLFLRNELSENSLSCIFSYVYQLLLTIRCTQAVSCALKGLITSNEISVRAIFEVLCSVSSVAFFHLLAFQ